MESKWISLPWYRKDTDKLEVFVSVPNYTVCEIWNKQKIFQTLNHIQGYCFKTNDWQPIKKPLKETISECISGRHEAERVNLWRLNEESNIVTCTLSLLESSILEWKHKTSTGWPYSSPQTHFWQPLYHSSFVHFIIIHFPNETHSRKWPPLWRSKSGI